MACDCRASPLSTPAASFGPEIASRGIPAVLGGDRRPQAQLDSTQWCTDVPEPLPVHPGESQGAARHSAARPRLGAGSNRYTPGLHSRSLWKLPAVSHASLQTAWPRAVPAAQTRLLLCFLHSLLLSHHLRGRQQLNLGLAVASGTVRSGARSRT